MATRSELIAALRQADEAGDAEGAQRIAAMLKSTPAAAAPAPKAAPKSNPLGEAAEAVGVGVSRAANSATFGLADKASAALASGLSRFTGQPMSYDEAEQSIQARRQAEGEEHPNAAVAGDVAGLFTGGLGLMKAAGAAAKLPGIGRPIAAVAERLAPVARQPARNVLRHAGSGALAGAVQPTVNAATGDGSVAEIPVGIAAGAAGGAVVGPLADALLPLTRHLDIKVARALARTLGESPADVQRAWARLRQDLGRPPSMAEMATLKARGEIKALAEEYGSVGEALAQRANAAAAERPGSMQAAVARTGPAASSGSLTNARRAGAAADYEPVDAGSYQLTPEAVEFLQGAALPSATLARPQRQAIAQALEDGEISGTDVQTLREQFGERAARDPASRYGQMLMDLDDHLDIPDNAALVQAHQAATANFRANSERIEGARLGERGASTRGDTANYLAEVDAAVAPRRGGTPNAAADTLAAGARSALSDRAASQTGALDLAQQLATDGGLHQRIAAAAGRDTADALQTLGRAEAASHEALSSVTQRTPTPDSKSEGDALQRVLHFTAVAQPHGSPVWRAFHFGQVMAGLRMSKPVQERVAQYLSDPAMVRQGISLLRKAGASNEELRRLALYGVGIAGVGGARVVEPDDFEAEAALR